MINGKIIVSVFVIGGSGVVNAALNGRPLTPVVIGAYVFLLVLSVADMFGGVMSQLSGALALIAATGIVLNQFPWQSVIALLHGSGAVSGGGTSSAK